MTYGVSVLEDLKRPAERAPQEQDFERRNLIDGKSQLRNRARNRFASGSFQILSN
jgi:DNA replication initiation complex subunit (GINS family)